MTKVDDGSHALRDLQRGYMTKHVVKGAAGGIRGADYDDLEAEYLERRDSAAARNLRADNTQREMVRSLMQAAAAGRLDRTADEAKAVKKAVVIDRGDVMDADLAVNVHAAKAAAEPIDAKAKLEDERVKKKLLLMQDDEDPDWKDEEEEDAEQDDDVEWVGPFADADVDEALRACDRERIGRLVQDPEVEMRIYGTARLVDPKDMRAALSTPLRVARHLRVIAGRLLASDEHTRQDVIHYLSGCLVNLGPTFGGAALRAFATSVGVGDIYPLEVLEHVARIAPDFVPRTTLAPFLPRRRRLLLRAGKAFTLRLDPALKVTGFALKGGGEPGYQFAPRQPPGEFGLNILTPGRFTLILCALDGHGFERLQEIEVLVLDPNDPDAVDLGAGDGLDLRSIAERAAVDLDQPSGPEAALAAARAALAEKKAAKSKPSKTQVARPGAPPPPAAADAKAPPQVRRLSLAPPAPRPGLKKKKPKKKIPPG